MGSPRVPSWYPPCWGLHHTTQYPSHTASGDMGSGTVPPIRCNRLGTSPGLLIWTILGVQNDPNRGYRGGQISGGGVRSPEGGPIHEVRSPEEVRSQIPDPRSQIPDPRSQIPEHPDPRGGPPWGGPPGGYPLNTPFEDPFGDPYGCYGWY